MRPSRLPPLPHWRSQDTVSVEPVPPSLQSLEGLFEEHHRRALGLAYQLLGNRQDAEEVVQDALLSVWRSAQTYDPRKSSPSTWVLSAVRHRAIDVLRSRERRARTDPYPADEVRDGRDVATEAITSLEWLGVLGGLAGLPVQQQQVVELAY